MSVVVQHRRDTTTNVEGNTPAAGELWMDTSRKELSLGDGALPGGVRLAKKNIRDIVVAAQITSNQNNYSPTDLKHAGVLNISSDAARNITGLVPLTVTDATDGREITLYNAGSFNIVLQDQNASSSAANRFDLGGADVTLAPKQSITLRYRTQGALNRWEVKARTDGQGIADGGVSARKLAISAAGGNIVNGQLVWSVGGNALTVALKTLAGGDPSATDPVFIRVRDVGLTTDSDSWITITAPLSQVVSSGSSLGTTNSVPFKLWAVFVNDGGTARLAVYNAVSLVAGVSLRPLAATGILSATSEGGAGAADSAQTFYSGAAVSAKAYAVLGNATWSSGLAAAGTWSSGPSLVQMFVAGVALPGRRTGNLTYVESTANTTLSTFTPADDSIPQVGEGNQILSAAIDPSNAAHLIELRFQGQLSAAATDTMTTALHVNGASNATAAEALTLTAANLKVKSTLDKMLAPGTTSTQTYTIRIGAAATSVAINGQPGGRFMGGVSAATLRAEEIAT